MSVADRKETGNAHYGVYMYRIDVGEESKRTPRSQGSFRGYDDNKNRRWGRFRSLREGHLPTSGGGVGVGRSTSLAVQIPSPREQARAVGIKASRE